jgi:hypothetical protein
MELIDLMEAETFEKTEFPILVVAQQVIARSAARLGFALHLSASSKQPYLRFHCDNGEKPTKVRAPDLSCCFCRLIHQPDCSYRFGLCQVAHNNDRVPAAFAVLLVSDRFRE